jgi:PIN domain nuclease of toxin-antitoxin system
MSILLDTQLLLWWQAAPERVPKWIIDELQNSENPPIFSVISIWEVVIKSALNRADFNHDADLIRASLIENGWDELGLSGRHVLAVSSLKLRHGDPFDRVLVAQAQMEKRLFVTTDSKLGDYGAWVKVVKARNAKP